MKRIVKNGDGFGYTVAWLEQSGVEYTEVLTGAEVGQGIQWAKSLDN